MANLAAAFSRLESSALPSAAVALDVLVRMTIVLAATGALARLCRSHVTVRHALLLTGLATACLTPAASTILEATGAPRWSLPIPLLGPRPAERPATAASAATRSRPGHNQTVASRSDATSRLGGPQSTPAPRGPNWRAASPSPAKWTGFVAGGLLAAWAAGAAARLFGLAASLVALRRIVAAARPAPALVAEPVIRRVQRRVGLGAPPRIYESGELSVPIAAGLFADAIILPEGCAPRLAPAELDSILCHEAAHLARRDHRVILFQEIVGSLLWWHPLVRRINRALTQAREEICDNYALAAIARPDYCRLLYRLATVGRAASPLGAASISSRRWPLEERVRGILDDRRQTVTKISSPFRISVVAAALGSGLLLALPEVSTRAAEQPADPDPRRIDLGTLTDERELPSAAREVHVAAEEADVVFPEAVGDRFRVEARVVLTGVAPQTKLPPARLADHASITVDGDVVTVTETPLPRNAPYQREMTISVSLPRALPIEVRTADGDVTIERPELDAQVNVADGDVAVRTEVSGAVETTTADGDIFVRAPRIRGALTARTSDGDVHVETTEVSGPLAVQSSDGDLSLQFGDAKDPAVESVSAQTGDGDVNVKFAGPGVKKELAIQTGEGDVRLQVSARVDANLAIAASRGEVSLAPSIREPKSLGAGASKMVSAQLGAGGAPFGLATGEGAVAIEVDD